MKYLCLIYEDETFWTKTPKPELDAMLVEYRAFGTTYKQSGHVPRRQRAAADHVGHDGPRPQRQDVHDGRSIRRDPRAVGRLLSARGEGPERGDPDRGQDSLREDGEHRGAPDHGILLSG